MHLGQVRVSFPVLRIGTRVYHSTPRPPTAFERVLLRLCDRFGNDPTYNNISLERIFIDILGVADPDPVVQPTVQKLLDLDVLRCRRDITSIGLVAIRDFEITDRGRSMLSDDMLPARSQEAEVTHLYDPVRGRFLSETESKLLRRQPSSASLDETAFLDVYPEEEIRQQVLEGRHPWWHEGSRIERIERVDTEVQWVEVQGDVELADGVVRISLRDKNQTAHLNSLPGDELFARVLRPILVGAGAERFPVDLLAPVESVQIAGDDETTWLPLPRALGEFPDAENVWLVNPVSSVSVPDEPPSGRCFIIFDEADHSEPVSIQWNPAGDGVVVHLSEAFPAPGGILASPRWLLLAHRVRVQIGRDGHDIPLACRTANSDQLASVRAALHELSLTLIQRTDEADALAPALWMDSEEYWDMLLGRLEANCASPAADLDGLLALRSRYSRLMGASAVPAWEGFVVRLLRASLAHLNNDMEGEAAEAVAVLLVKCGLTSPAAIAEALQLLTGRTAAPANLQSFARISDAFRKGGIRWRLPYPCRLYSPAVMAAIAQQFGQADLERALSNENDFESAIRGLQQLAAALATAFGIKTLAGELDDESYHACLRQPDIGKNADILDAWEAKYAAFLQAFPEMVPHLEGSALGTAHRHITSIGLLLRKLATGVDPRFREVFIIDTSVFVDAPTVLNLLRPDQLAVVSKRVLEELDDQKQNEALRPRIAEATRALNAFPKDRIQFCDADLSLLPPDYRLKGDNLILSVALKYRRYRPILLTNDNNLALKARAENIDTMRLDALKRRTGGRPSKPPAGSQARHPGPAKKLRNRGGS